MKRGLLLIVGIVLALSIFSQSQVKINLQPGAEEGKDTWVRWIEEEWKGVDYQNTNFGKANCFAAIAWTFNGLEGAGRCLLEFDLSAIPNDATILSAKLSLYHTRSAEVQSSLSGSNEVLIQRVTSPWDESTVTWNTKPSATEENQLLVPRIDYEYGDLIDFDVLPLIEDIQKTENYGFMLSLKTESYYRRMTFATSDHENEFWRPKLELVYEDPNGQPLISKVRKISATEGGFTGTLYEDNGFGRICSIGDIDGDGIKDLAAGTPGDTDGGIDTGAIWILFMNEDGTVRSQQKINNSEGKLNANISGSRFGNHVEALGDVDSDGVSDIAVGAYYDADAGGASGAVYILFLNNDGTVKTYQKISATQGGLEGLGRNRFFGSGFANLGDMNNDGLLDFAVGVPHYDADGGTYKGSIWMLSLNTDGTVADQFIVSENRGGFFGKIDSHDRFGRIVTNIGDVNNDGIDDLAVSAEGDDDGGTDYGAFYILFLNIDKTVKGFQKISSTEGHFNGRLSENSFFGNSHCKLGDIDGDDIMDILIGCPKSDSGGEDLGTVYILYLNIDGTVKKYEEIGFGTKGLTEMLESGDKISGSLSCNEGFDENGKKKLFVSATGDDDGATDAGAFYIMDLDVKHKPTAFAGEDYGVCAGEPFMLDGTMSNVLDNDSLEYLWQSNDLYLTDSTSASLEFIAPYIDQTTQYEAYLNVSCDGIISETDTILVTIYPVNEKPKMIHENDQLSVTDEAFEYKWYLNGNVIENQINSSIQLNGNGYYKVELLNELGCSSGFSDSMEIQLAPVAVIECDVEFCSNQQIILDAGNSEVAKGQTVNYLWGIDNYELTDSTSEQIIFVAPDVNQTEQLTFTLTIEQGGYVSELTSVEITVYPAPERPMIEVNGSTLEAVLDENEYQWYFNNMMLDHEITKTLEADRNGFYQVVAENEFGCVSEKSDSMEVTFVPIAKAYGSRKVCSSTMIYLDGTESSSPVSGNLDFYWSCDLMEVPDNTLQETSFIAPVVEVETVYEFYLQVFQNEIKSAIDTFVVTINPAPVEPEIEQFADTLVSSEGAEYQWYLEGSEIDGATEQIYVIEKSGLYYVKIANDYGCVSDPSRELNVIKTDGSKLLNGIRLYPNPTTGYLNISGLESNAKGKVVDLKGAVVKTFVASNEECTLDMNELKDGIYFIHLDTGNEIHQILKKGFQK